MSSNEEKVELLAEEFRRLLKVKNNRQSNQALETEKKLHEKLKMETALKSGDMGDAAAAITDDNCLAWCIVQGSLYAKLKGGYEKNKIQFRLPTSTTAKQLIEEVSRRFEIDSDSLYLTLASRQNILLHNFADETLDELGFLCAAGYVNILFARDKENVKEDVISENNESYDDSDIPLGAEASDYSVEIDWCKNHKDKGDATSAIRKVVKSYGRGGFLYAKDVRKIQGQEIPIVFDKDISDSRDLWRSASPPNVWKERNRRAEEIEAMQPRTEQDEEAMIQQAIELSRLQALEDEKRRRTLQEEQEIQMQYMASVSAENSKDQVVDTFQTELNESGPNKKIAPQETSKPSSLISSSTSLQEEEALRFGGAKPKFKKIADRFGGWGTPSKSSESNSRGNKDENSKDSGDKIETGITKSIKKVYYRTGGDAMDRRISSWSTADRDNDKSKNTVIDCENFWDDDITTTSKTPQDDANYFGSKKNKKISPVNDQLDNCEDSAADENDAEVESYFQDQSFFWKPKRTSKKSEDGKEKLELDVLEIEAVEHLPSESTHGKAKTVASSCSNGATSHTQLKNTTLACDSNIAIENLGADGIHSASTLPNNKVLFDTSSRDDFSNSKFENESSSTANINKDLENFSIYDQEKKTESLFSEQPQDLYNVFLDRKPKESDYLQSTTFDGRAPLKEHSQAKAPILTDNNSQIPSDINQALYPSSFNSLNSNKIDCLPVITSNEEQHIMKDNSDASEFTSECHNSNESSMPIETMRNPMDNYVSPEHASFMNSQFLPIVNPIAKTMDPSLMMHQGMLNQAMANPLLMQMQQMMMLSNPFFAQQLHALQMFSLGMSPAFPYTMPVPNLIQANPAAENHLVAPQRNLQLPFFVPESPAINAFANAEIGDGGLMKLPISKPAGEPTWKVPEATRTPSLPPGIDVSYDLHPPVSDYSFSEIENILKKNVNSPNASELFIPAPRPAGSFSSNDGDKQQSLEKSSNVLQPDMNALRANHVNSSAFVESLSNIGYNDKNYLGNRDGNAERAYGSAFPPQQNTAISKEVFLLDDLNQSSPNVNLTDVVYSEQSFNPLIPESSLGKKSHVNGFESSDGAMDKTNEYYKKLVCTPFGNPRKSLNFDEKNSRPWKVLEIPGKYLNFLKMFLNPLTIG